VQRVRLEKRDLRVALSVLGSCGFCEAIWVMRFCNSIFISRSGHQILGIFHTIARPPHGASRCPRRGLGARGVAAWPENQGQRGGGRGNRVEETKTVRPVGRARGSSRRASIAIHLGWHPPPVPGRPAVRREGRLSNHRKGRWVRVTCVARESPETREREREGDLPVTKRRRNWCRRDAHG